MAALLAPLEVAGKVAEEAGATAAEVAGSVAEVTAEGVVEGAVGAAEAAEGVVGEVASGATKAGSKASEDLAGLVGDAPDKAGSVKEGKKEGGMIGFWLLIGGLIGAYLLFEYNVTDFSYIVTSGNWNGILLISIIGVVLFLCYHFKWLVIDDNIINRIVYFMIVIYIFHILWVILTFTSPSSPNSCDIIKKKTEKENCNIKGLYYGQFPYEKADELDYTEYIFNPFVWFPPKYEPSDDDKCMPCGMDMVATSVSGCKGKSCDGKSCGNVKCRKCAENEAWISFKDIKGNLKNNLYKDYSSALEKVERNTEIKDKLGEYGVCISYSDIMAENNLYKDDDGGGCDSYENCVSDPSYSPLTISWDEDTDPVLPRQVIHLRDYKIPVSLIVPDKILTNYNQVKKDKVNPIYSNIYNNEYGNKICEKGEGGDGKCSFTIPIKSDRGKAQNITTPLHIRDGVSCGVNDPNCFHSALACKGPNLDIHRFNGKIETPVPLNSINSFDVQDTEYDWRHTLDQARKMCIDESSNGMCYVNKHNYICTTIKNTAIPLVDGDKLVIPEYTKKGCQNPLLVSNCNTKKENSPCPSALKVDENGFLVNEPGVCKNVTYKDGKWKLSNATPSDMRCIPTDKVAKEIKEIVEPTLINDVPGWLSGNTLPTIMCYRVQRSDNLYTKKLS